jgi:hypothetical protein
MEYYPREDAEYLAENAKEGSNIDEWGMRTKYRKPLVVQAFVDSNKALMLGGSYANSLCSKHCAVYCTSYFDNIQEVKRAMSKEHWQSLFDNKLDCIVDEIEEIKCSYSFESLNSHKNLEGIFSGLQLCCVLNCFLRNSAFLK